MRRIGVIGGGLAGLMIAHRRLAAGDEVVLFEADARLGGQLWTERCEGFVVEHGAEGFLARSEVVPTLAAEIGIAGDLLAQAEQRSWGLDDRGLRELAPGEAAAFLGFAIPREELGRGLRTFRRGMGQLTEALEQVIGGRAEIRRATRVTAVLPGRDGVRIASADTDTQVDAAVITTPAARAALLLEGAFGDAARALASSLTISSVTVTLAYPRAAIDHPLDGSGFVVAEAQQREGLRAATFVTSKFPGRAPDGQAAVRLFFRPARGDEALDDAAWIARAEAGFARVIPVRGGATRAWVARWLDAMPGFDRRHAERVQVLEGALAESGILLAGAAFHGSGLDAAARSAEAAARLLG